MDDYAREAEEKIENLIHYMRFKIEERDFHAVADAAMDIRELEERIRTLKLIASGRLAYKTKANGCPDKEPHNGAC